MKTTDRSVFVEASRVQKPGEYILIESDGIFAPYGFWQGTRFFEELVVVRKFAAYSFAKY